MTYDPVPLLARFAGNRNIAYTLLSDPDSEIIRAFGLLDEEVPPGSPWYGIAHPLTLVVDSEGIVRRRFSEGSYQERPDVDVVLDVLREEAGR